MAERGHYRGRGGTRQGIYVMSPGGVLLASVNTLKAPRVLEALKKGLEAWQKLPAEKRRLTSPEVIKAEHRWEQSRPDDGLVLRVCSREVPVGFGAETKRGPWNLDHAWFTRKEARQFLSAESHPL